MFKDIKDNPEWRHLSLDEYREYAGLYDACPCNTAYLGLYQKLGILSRDFVVICHHCNTYVYADSYVNAMIGWNKKCRHLKGQI